MKNKILFLAATHGDEGFSIPILQKIEKKYTSINLNWLIGNPKALKEERRYIDMDLNRVSPGKKNSKMYESKRAYELQKEFDNYDYVIDIHGTPAKTGIFTIVTNSKKENLLLATMLPIRNVVIWTSKDMLKPGPITKFTDCGVEIECGPKNSAVIKKELYKIIRYFIKNETKQKQKVFYRVYGLLRDKDIKDRNYLLKEFKKISIGNEEFYPLLINRYPDIACYKMKKININLK